MEVGFAVLCSVAALPSRTAPTQTGIPDLRRNAVRPHVRGRIVTMHRSPDGVDGKSFYQKRRPDYIPDWIETVEVEEDGVIRQLTIENAATLAWLANQDCVEIHVWPGRADRPHHPDRMIFDLDPSTDDFDLVRRASSLDGARGWLDELAKEAGDES